MKSANVNFLLIIFSDINIKFVINILAYLIPQKYIIMFFLYLAIDQSKIAIKEPIATPEVYTISVSIRIMDITGEKTCFPDDPDCPKENFDDPSTYKCGQICISDKGATFSYKLKGVQFLVIKIPNMAPSNFI